MNFRAAAHELLTLNYCNCSSFISITIYDLLSSPVLDRHCVQRVEEDGLCFFTEFTTRLYWERQDGYGAMLQFLTKLLSFIGVHCFW